MVHDVSCKVMICYIWMGSDLRPQVMHTGCKTSTKQAKGKDTASRAWLVWGFVFLSLGYGPSQPLFAHFSRKENGIWFRFSKFHETLSWCGHLHVCIYSILFVFRVPHVNTSQGRAELVFQKKDDVRAPEKLSRSEDTQDGAIERYPVLIKAIHSGITKHLSSAADRRQGRKMTPPKPNSWFHRDHRCGTGN